MLLRHERSQAAAAPSRKTQANRERIARSVHKRARFVRFFSSLVIRAHRCGLLYRSAIRLALLAVFTDIEAAPLPLRAQRRLATAHRRINRTNDMDRARAATSARDYFETTSFLDGANAIYIEHLQDRYHADPNSVDAEWREFFASLEEDIATARKSTDGPSWKRANWPIPVHGELTSALDGNWAPNAKLSADKVVPLPPARPVSNLDIQQATRDSVRALMMIRAYRMRGHLHANLDPLGWRSRWTMKSFIHRPMGSPKPTSTGRSSSTACSAWNSPPSARCSISCDAPIAGPSATNSCTSPIPRRRPGSGTHRRPKQEFVAQPR